MNTIDSLSIKEFINGVFQLRAEVFQQIDLVGNGLIVALLIVLIAGLSLAIGECVILFINRVKPVRFVFSLLLNAVLYVFGFLFLVISTWLMCQLFLPQPITLTTLLKVFGLSYIPILFSFLSALPYLGKPILSILSVLHLLAMVVGFSIVADTSTPIAFCYVALGWFVKETLENTIGQPIALFGRKIAEGVAKVDLADNKQELLQILQSGIEQLSSPMETTTQTYLPLPQTVSQTSSSSFSSSSSSSANFPKTPNVNRFVANQPTTANTSTTSTTATTPKQNKPIDLSSSKKQNSRAPNSFSKTATVLSILAMVVFFVAIAISLQPIRSNIFVWYDSVPEFLRLIYNLIWIGLIAIIFAGLLAPLETLGWWAGWYNDELDTSDTDVVPESPKKRDKSVSRYLIYLDGIGQSGQEYTPDVADFIQELKSILPEDMELVEGLMMYSVLNKPLVQNRPLAFLWKLADKTRWANPTALLGILVNLRNVLIVAVSADKRYGPIYNQGLAQTLYKGLTRQGYQAGSGVPVTLIGYSGGAEMATAAAPYLLRSIGTPIDVISLGGVMSAKNNLLKLEHLYHLAGEKDQVEKIGAIVFPGRWQVFRLSYWNRAKRKGKISFISLGPVEHQVPNGLMDPNAILPDGRTHLQQTIDVITNILNGRIVEEIEDSITPKTSNYERYKQADFNHPAYYPLEQTVDENWYKPIGNWIGRLILPKLEDRSTVKGVLFEIHHADTGYEHLVGQIVNLRWSNDQRVQNQVRAVTRDVHFSVDAQYSSKYDGQIHPSRINHWQQVDPLESLAGSHPTDDIIVMLENKVEIEVERETTTLRIRNQPVQITGRYYALIKFIQPVKNSDRFEVVHFNSNSGQFDGLTESIQIPRVMADLNGCFPSTSNDIQLSPLNEIGWYIYGAKDASGTFVVQSLAPRSLLRLEPDRVLFGRKSAYEYIRNEAWSDILDQKGQVSSVLLSTQEESVSGAINQWQEGDRALLLHVYGGIGGEKKEPAAAAPIFFGHFAYGLATVVKEPLADELRFEIQYHQVYTHNTDGLVAGTLHWSRYMGDRQFGWVGTRPVCDILIKQNAFTGNFDINEKKTSALNLMLRHLQVMTARYRIGDGTGATYVGAANNCSQDSNQALFASLRSLELTINTNEESLQSWLSDNPQQAERYQQLRQLQTALRKQLQPLGSPRADWQENEYNLGSTLEDAPLRNLVTGLGSWRTLLPRLASDTIVSTFLDYNASVWVLRTTQIGGNDPDIEPIAPITL